MGDWTELSGLLTVTGFIALTVLFIGIIPTDFFESTYTGLTVEVPEVFEAVDIQEFADVDTFIMNETGGYDKGDYYMMELKDDESDEWLGGHDLDFWYKDPDKAPLDLYINHWYAKMVILLQADALEWKSGEGVNRGTKLSADELNTDYAGEDLRYTARCAHLILKVFFAFNDTTYDTPSQAWEASELNVLVGINFDQTATSYNAFALITMLLFFQLPAIHWFVNAIIAIPIWICIVYLVAILFYRAIEALKPFS